MTWRDKIYKTLVESGATKAFGGTMSTAIATARTTEPSKTTLKNMGPMAKAMFGSLESEKLKKSAARTGAMLKAKDSLIARGTTR